jgi:mRNA interferase MazF
MSPQRGVVWLDFDAQAGREQAARRPCLVLSPASYNTKSSLMLCCPVTSQVKGYPFEVPVLAGSGSTQVNGVVLCDQVRALDWNQRNASKIGFVSTACLLDVSAKVKALLP